MNVSSVTFGMEETGIVDPRVKTMNPFSDPLANLSNSYDHHSRVKLQLLKNINGLTSGNGLAGRV